MWVREPREARLELAQALGAERHGNELVDVAIVCTPKPDAIAAAAAALAPGGTLCLYAPPAPDAPPAARRHARCSCDELTVTASYSAGPARHARGVRADRLGRDRPAAAGLAPAARWMRPARALELQRSGEALKVVVLP